MIAVITEKPSVAKDIARVLGVTQKKEGYIQGKDYMITWASGHLVAPAFPEEYGFEGQKAEDYPFIPEEFKLVPRKIKCKDGYRDDPGVVKQLQTIKWVFSACDGIINCCDAGREGELVFRYIYNYLKCKKPFSRLWISSMTDKAIREGFQNLKDGSCYDGLFLAAQARSQADWLLGINASRALHISSGGVNNSLGRVQTPTLALICKRFLDNRGFKEQPYWQNFLNLNFKGVDFRAVDTEQFFDKGLAEKAFVKIKQAAEAEVCKYTSREVIIEAPLPHDLASLQKLANIKHGFGAEKTLSIAQKLYEGGYISYPRTGSRYIPQDVFETIPALIAKLKNYPRYDQYAGMLCTRELNRKPVDPGKVTDHHALVTTEVIPRRLDSDESIIYELIAGRLLEAFSEKGINDTVHVGIACGGLVLEARQSTVKYSGWRDVSGEKDEPEPLYTEAALLTAMETAGRNSNDTEIRTALSACGIGTPATRAAIIGTLFKREYIALQNKSLVPTKKGLSLYKQIARLQIADVEITGGWEAALLKIEDDPGFLTSFNGGIRVFTKQAVTEILSIASLEDNSSETPYICPACRLGKMVLWPRMAKCGYSKCNFRIYREIAGKVLNDKAMQSLLLKGRTPLLKGFKSRLGKAFEARVVLDKDNKTMFEFPPGKRRAGNGNS